MMSDGYDGLLVAEGNVDELAAALSRLMGDEKLRRILGANASAAADRFAPDTVGTIWEQTIRQVLVEARDTTGQFLER
jgi:glycosyltransferase involved in cell wall biosynthesis